METKGSQFLKFISIAALLSIGFIILIVNGPQKVNFTLPGVDKKLEETIHNLNFDNKENPNLPAPKTVNDQFLSLRKKALDKSRQFMDNRDTLNLWFNILSVLSVVVSFAVTIIGATKGLNLNAEHINKGLPQIKAANKQFKGWVIILSAVAVLFTGLANRCSAYADKEQSKGLEIIGLIKTADVKVEGALDIKEVKTTTDGLELDMAKY